MNMPIAHDIILKLSIVFTLTLVFILVSLSHFVPLNWWESGKKKSNDINAEEKNGKQIFSYFRLL